MKLEYAAARISGLSLSRGAMSPHSRGTAYRLLLRAAIRACAARRPVPKTALFVSAAIILSPLAQGEAAPAAPDSLRAAAGPRPSLWTKAVAVFESNKKLVPGKALQTMEELDKEGRVKSTANAEISFALDSAGKVATSIVRATKDGKDTTAEERKRAAERGKKEAAAKKGKPKRDSDESSHSFAMNDGPLSDKLQSDVRVTPSGATETIDGASCARFEFTYPEKREAPVKGKPIMVKGSAWLEEGSGRPVKIEYTYEPLPKHVKQMRTELRYGAEGADAWILRRMSFEASGSFLIFGKSIRGAIDFSDYWKYEGPDTL